MMTNLSGKVGELRFTVTVKRAATGETETHELVGKITEDQAEKLGLKEKQDGSDPQHGGA